MKAATYKEIMGALTCRSQRLALILNQGLGKGRGPRNDRAMMRAHGEQRALVSVVKRVQMNFMLVGFLIERGMLREFRRWAAEKYEEIEKERAT